MFLQIFKYDFSVVSFVLLKQLDFFKEFSIFKAFKEFDDLRGMLSFRDLECAYELNKFRWAVC